MDMELCDIKSLTISYVCCIMRCKEQVFIMNDKNNFYDIVFTDADKFKLILINSGRRVNAYRHEYTHNTKNIILSYVEKGETTYYVNNKGFKLQEGMLYMVSPHCDCHYKTSDKEWSIHWIGIGGSDSERLLNILGLNEKNPILNLKNGDTVCLYLKKIFESAKDTSYIGKVNVQILLYSLISELLKNSDIANDTSTNYIEAVDRLIRYNYAEKITVSKIAEVLHLDRSYLSRLYKSSTGISIKEKLTKQRLISAKELLKKGETVKKVAFKSGFSDPLYFSKSYKKEFGHSPSEDI